jgi:hypothetical protein
LASSLPQDTQQHQSVTARRRFSCDRVELRVIHLEIVAHHLGRTVTFIVQSNGSHWFVESQNAAISPF